MRRRTRLLALLTSLLLLAVACGGGDDGDAEEPAATGGEATTDGGEDDQAAQPMGGTLVIDKSFDLQTADPHRMYEVTGTMLVRAMYDTLLTFVDGDVSTPQPSIASEWEASEDATTFTFTLRDDVTFSDGSPLEAKDVVWSLNRVKNLKGNGSFLLEGVEITSPDEGTVVLTTAEPNPALPAILPTPTLSIVNSDVAMENGASAEPGADQSDTAEEFLNSESAGSGPYMLESFSTTSETVIVPNPSYWGEGGATYERVVLRNADASTQRLNVQSGQSQIVLDLSGDQLEGLADQGLNVLTETSPNIWFLFANANCEVSEVTCDPAFREAVRYGLDYEAIVALAGEGAIQAPGVIPSMFVGALEGGDAVQRDVERATAALEEAGLENPAVSLEYPSDFTANGLAFGPIAERIKANLADVGINVELTPGPIATALENYRNGTEEMGLWLWAPDYPDPVDYLVFTPGELVGLRAGWAEGAAPEIEQLADEAAQTIGDDVRGPIFQDIQRKLNESGPFFPLFQPTAAVVASPEVDGVQFHPSWTLEIAALSPTTQ